MATTTMSRSTRSRRFRRLSTSATVVLLVGSACASTPDDAVDPEVYRTALGDICEQTVAKRSERADPVDGAAVAQFAQDTATDFRDEAEAIRALRPPDELDSDHRAFIQNTDDQAQMWATLSTVPAGDGEAFGETRTVILELALGRDDLANEMGVERCQVTATVGT